jgi:hypothetical protein
MVVISFPFIFMPCLSCDTPIVPQWITPTPWILNNTGPILEPLPTSVEAAWWQRIIYYSPFVILFQIGWAAVQIAHLSLIPELASTDQGRTELTAIRLVYIFVKFKKNEFLFFFF